MSKSASSGPTRQSCSTLCLQPLGDCIPRTAERHNFTSNQIGPATRQRPGPWSFPGKGNDMVNGIRQMPRDAGRAACSDPAHLPLVDAAFARPGGPEARSMARNLCRTCPVAEACFAWAIAHPEAGVWAGTSPKLRTLHGAPSEARHERAATG